MKYPARGLLFDLDGTLIDSVPDIAGAIVRMLDQLKLPARSASEIRGWVGNGAPRLVQRALTGEDDGQPETTLFERALPLFYDLYADHVYEESVLYDGVMETLRKFADEGFKMACVTNKPERHTLPLLKAAGLSRFFSGVVAGDTLGVKKPDPEPLLHAADQIGVQSAHCVMIGDSLSDIRAASAAGMQMLCLTYGYNQGVDLAASSADQLLDSFAALADRIVLA